MKKGLSVLLIAAALFGFYGGATSLNDVLASKDYWEEVGEKSTADMNKLEDGLNQLKDNEKAYLDGQKELADGEVKLADAEKQLADGEAKLAAGKAELAKGYADYAAAPGQLADAEKELAAGKAKLEDAEEQLAEGKTKLDGLSQLINGINDTRSGYATWKKGYDELHKNRKALVAGLDADTGTGVTVKQALLGVVAPKVGGGFAAAVNALDDKNQFADGYRDFSTNAKTVANGVSGLITQVTQVNQAATASKSASKASLATTAGKTAAITTLVASEKFDQAAAAALVAQSQFEDPVESAKAIGTIQTVAGLVESNTSDSLKSLKALQAAYTSNLTKFAAAVDENIGTLEKGQTSIANAVATIASNVLGNKELKAGVKKNFGQAAISLLSAYSSSAGPLSTKISSFEAFETQMDSNPGIDAFLLKARNLLAQTRAEGAKTYSAGLAEYKQGRATYDAGLAKYNKGLADYAAAPAKLADGERQVADGEAQLADGYKQYEDGKKALEDGKKQLAQYEDGEQQVRDGLATLMATEADPGLESILDRRNGDDKFDDANGHLQLDEGLEAVDTGRGYQAESGELITKEVTNRAVGTAAGLGAAALAVLAAILSFLKKNKGAAVSAVLAAVAGGIGAGVGLSAGEYYSDIAGSTIGNTPFIAAAILAVVAAVFAIVHFTAKPEAK